MKYEDSRVHLLFNMIPITYQTSLKIRNEPKLPWCSKTCHLRLPLGSPIYDRILWLIYIDADGFGYGLGFGFQGRWLHCSMQNMFRFPLPCSPVLDLILVVKLMVSAHNKIRNNNNYGNIFGDILPISDNLTDMYLLIITVFTGQDALLDPVGYLSFGEN